MKSIYPIFNQIKFADKLDDWHYLFWSIEFQDIFPYHNLRTLGDILELLKGSNRQCMVVELRLQYCREIFSIHLSHKKRFKDL